MFCEVGIFFFVVSGIIVVFGCFVYLGILLIYCDFVQGVCLVIGYLKIGGELDWVNLVVEK